MQDEMKDDNWVFDSLIGFLTSPVWNIPFLNFVESNSLAFEGNPATNEEYSKIHNEYKKLVDTMLSTFMQDLGITSEQFEGVCKRATNDVNSTVQQALFEQIWAAENLETFIHMMTSKNLDMQLQTLRVFQRQHGIPSNPESQSAEDSDSILEEVLRKSLEEHQNTLTAIEGEQEAIEQTLKLSLAEIRRLEAEKMKENELLERVLALSLEDSAGISSGVIRCEDEIKQEPAELSSTNATPIVVDFTPEDVALRQQYLRHQRDKLVDMKRKQRVEQLQGLSSVHTIDRPNSARTAKEILENGTNKCEPASGATSALVDSNTLAARKALVARLRKEVIGNIAHNN